MWGSTFTDFAKKAQELQEQATEAASSISHSNAAGGLFEAASSISHTNAGGLFNLDSMRSQVEEESSSQQKKKAAATSPPEVEPTPTRTTTSTTASISMDSLFQTPQPVKPISPNSSKLKVPTSPLRGVPPTTTTSNNKSATPTTTPFPFITSSQQSTAQSPLLVNLGSKGKDEAAVTATTTEAPQTKVDPITQTPAADDNIGKAAADAPAPAAAAIVAMERKDDAAASSNNDDDDDDDDAGGWDEDDEIGGLDDMEVDDEGEQQQQKSIMNEEVEEASALPQTQQQEEASTTPVVVVEKEESSVPLVEKQQEHQTADMITTEPELPKEKEEKIPNLEEPADDKDKGGDQSHSVPQQPVDEEQTPATVQQAENGDDDHGLEKEGFENEQHRHEQQQVEAEESQEAESTQQQQEEEVEEKEGQDPLPQQPEHDEAETTTDAEPSSPGVPAPASTSIDGGISPPPHRVEMDRDVDGEGEQPTATATPNDGGQVEGESGQKPAAAVPDELLEQFSHQMQRLEENHQAERNEMEQRYVAQIQELEASFNHDACEAARQELEQSLLAQIQEKEDQLHEVVRVNEGMKLKLDVLKREVTGTQQLLEARDSDIKKGDEQHLRGLRDLEKKMNEAEQKALKFQNETLGVKDELESRNKDFSALQHEHADLKARVKTVASELKDRRGECRELRAVIDEKEEANEKLAGELENLRYQVSDQDRSGTEKAEEMEQLRANLVDARAEIEKAEKAKKVHEARAEKALAEYKRKAQNSLALANSRAASAVQAKEEADLEARAARATADSAMERAVTAEIASKGAVAEAKAYASEMEKKKEDAVKEMESARDELKQLQKDLADSKEQQKKSESENERISEALKGANNEIEQAKDAASSLQDELDQSQARVNSLRDDIATLREQLVRAEAAAQSEAKKEVEEEVLKTASSQGANVSVIPSDDATVRILQEELRDANKAIEELKEALANAVALSEQRENSAIKDTNKEYEHQSSSLSNGESSSTPLFYAMEKQAELNTARGEINRLANLLSNAQSEKMEAYESMEEMKKRMDDAEARLMRFEKLASPSDAGVAESPAAPSSNGGVTRRTSGAVNIEYLKNIMMRYLNAHTLAEKKALVPVIGAVLCLTPDEQQAAMQNLESSASLGGVGSSLFESISHQLM